MDRRVIKEGNIYKHIGYDKLPLETPDGATTLLQLIQNKCATRGSEYFLGTIVNDRIQYMTYDEFMNKSYILASFFEEITQEKEIIGMCSVNRKEWLMGEFASYLANCCNCPLYTSFGTESMNYILKEAEIKILLISNDKAKAFLSSVFEKQTSGIKFLILMDGKDDCLEIRYREKGVTVYGLPEILCKKKITLTRTQPTTDDIATIAYTSGTSGMPKGVILTHKNFISIASAFIRNKDPNDLVIVAPGSVYLSFLPLSHVLERICFLMFVLSSGRIVFYSGNPKRLQKDFEIAKPTLFVAVPRVLNIFQEKIQAAINERNWFVRMLFKIGLKYKSWLQFYNIYTSFFFDYLIFDKIASRFGGRTRHCLCGAAAISPDVVQFIQATLSCKVFLGYGQTEGLGANILQPLDCTDLTTVGIPFRSTVVKLEPVPDYPEVQGEILLKGPSITPGYYKRNEETLKAFTNDGWMRTGDLAVERNGYFYLVGRIKEVFKTSFGEYIIPEKLENYFVGGIIEDVLITNSQFSDYLLAIVVSTNGDHSENNLLKEIQTRGNMLVEEKKINRYEIPVKVIKVSHPFSVLDFGNLVTPTLKKRREKLKMYFKDEIDQAYASL